MNHPKHPSCPGCGKALYKAFEKGKAVKKDDPWNFCRNADCERSGADGLGAAFPRTPLKLREEARVEKALMRRRRVRAYGDAYDAVVDKDKDKEVQPVRSSAIGRLLHQRDFAVEVDDGGVPRAAVEEAETLPELGVYFWHHHYKFDEDFKTQLCTHVTKFTPNWCPKHKFAHDRTRCPACALKAFKKSKKATLPEHPAIAETRKRLEQVVEAIMPADAPPAAIGLLMALLNQATGSKAAANLLIDEYGLDKKFGLQKF